MAADGNSSPDGGRNTVDDLLQMLLDATNSDPESLAPTRADRTAPAVSAQAGDVESNLPPGHIANIKFTRFKALRRFELPLFHMNILTGANNAGKSTALSVLRILGAGLAVAKRKRPVALSASRNPRRGYHVPTEGLPVSLENVSSDLAGGETIVEVTYSNGGALILGFPPDGGCVMYVSDDSKTWPRTQADFQRDFPSTIVAVPVLGPIEHDEKLLKRETVTRGLATHRAARHFRNYWCHFPDGFDRFRDLVESTWPGMTVEPPESQTTIDGVFLSMFCREERMTRELYWAGFGFQIWCQLLTHVSRAGPGDVLVVDEPETYLHPVIQRRLLSVLRETGAQVVLATHSASVVMAAQSGEVVRIDNSKRAALRSRRATAALAYQLGLVDKV